MTPRFRYWEIMPRLFVTSFPTGEDVKSIGATAVVTVSTNVRKPLPEDLAPSVHPHHYHIGVRSGWDPKRLEEYWPAVDKVCELLTQGHTVVVHCLLGRDRSATVAALAARRFGEPGTLEWLRERRPGAVRNPRLEAAWNRGDLDA